MIRWLTRNILALLADVNQMLDMTARNIVTASDSETGVEKKRLWVAILLLPFRIFFLIWMALLSTISFPFRGFWLLSNERKKWVLQGIPAIFAALISGAALFYAILNQQSIQTHYRIRMQQAMVDGDFKLASLLGGRVIAESETPTPELLLNQAIALANSGETNRSQSILYDLAPDDRQGYGPAHRSRVFLLERQLGPNANGELLSKLKWHLECCDKEKNPELEQSWARYYLITNQTTKAAEHLEKAAQIDPKLLLPLADLYETNGNSTASQRVLRQAVEELTRLLRSKPTDNRARMMLSLAFVKQKQFGEAEREVMVAMQLSPDPSTLRSVADYYLMRFDQMTQESAPIVQRLKSLKRALEIDKNYPSTYDRLIILCSTETGTKESEQVQLMLKKAIVDGNAIDLAHFALSSILLAEGKMDEAKLHLEQSLAQNKEMPMVCNNLAWVLAHRDPPDLSKAEQLSIEALAKMPDNATFHDTLGTIRMKQGKLLEAATELELACVDTLTNNERHLKLAELYEKLGDKSLANLHREKVLVGSEMRQ